MIRKEGIRNSCIAILIIIPYNTNKDNTHTTGCHQNKSPTTTTTTSPFLLLASQQLTLSFLRVILIIITGTVPNSSNNIRKRVQSYIIHRINFSNTFNKKIVVVICPVTIILVIIVSIIVVVLLVQCA